MGHNNQYIGDTMKVTINIQGINNIHNQVIDVPGAKGQIDVNGTGTNKKLQIVAKGICNDKKVDVEYVKKGGKKAKISVKECPKKQLKHFKKKCEKIAKIWEKQIKKS